MNDLFLEVRNFISGALAVDPTTIDELAALGETPQWDSLKHMEISIEFERKFGISLDADTIVQISSAQGMLKLLESTR